MSKIIILLADGFEEIEAISIIDITRRAGIDTIIASIKDKTVTGAHQVIVTSDCLLSDITSIDEYDAIVLPGGEPGTTHLEQSAAVRSIVEEAHKQGKYIAAICAAPRALDQWGLLTGKPATSYPSTKENMTHCLYSEDAVVVSDNIITSRGPGTAMAFAYKLVELLKTPTHAQQLKDAMVFTT